MFAYCVHRIRLTTGVLRTSSVERLLTMVFGLLGLVWTMQISQKLQALTFGTSPRGVADALGDYLTHDSFRGPRWRSAA